MADETKVEHFSWDEKSSQVALALAEGKTQSQVAKECSISRTTIWRWLQIPEFAEEVDRLTLMTGIATRAERLRIAKRVVNQKTKGITIRTEKDLLDWLKFAQSETDGIKLDLAKIAAALGEDAP